MHIMVFSRCKLDSAMQKHKCKKKHTSYRSVLEAYGDEVWNKMENEYEGFEY